MDESTQFQALLNQISNARQKVIDHPDSRYGEGMSHLAKHMTYAETELIIYLQNKGFGVGTSTDAKNRHTWIVTKES